MAERDPAKARLWGLTLARLAGLGLVLLGLWLAGRAAGAGARTLSGLGVVLAGLVWFLFVPRLLLRRWRSGG